jgi:putative ABC transport system substrate-binding protein
MNRREFIVLLAGAVIICGGDARADNRGRRLIGFLSPAPRGSSLLNVFIERMHQLGYHEHENFEIEERYADGNAERLPGLAQELVVLQPDVILVANTSSAVAMKRATSSIPIVAALMIDPVGAGLTTNEARPGGNFTGLLFAAPGLAGKQLEMAMELVPGARNIGVLVNVTNPANLAQRRDLEKESEQRSIKLIFGELRHPDDVDPALQALSEQTQAIIVLADTMLSTASQHIASVAIERKLPTIYGFREPVAAGGLASYGINRSDKLAPGGGIRR